MKISVSKQMAKTKNKPGDYSNFIRHGKGMRPSGDNVDDPKDTIKTEAGGILLNEDGSQILPE